MKKILLYITLPFIGLMIASLYIRKPAHTGIHLATDVASNLLFVDTLKVPSAIDDELRYYFERHNVEDEGYEMVVAFANGKRHHVSVDTYVPVRNIGTWREYDREGSALILDTEGRTIIGTCHADTIETGVRIDSIGTYMGDFSQTKAHGHGAYYRPNGDYAEGHWENDRQHGFGLELLQPDNGEQALEIADNLIRSGAIDIIVVDSVAALTPKAEIDGEMGDSKVGLQARLMSQAMRKLTSTISKTNCCCIFINQLREKIGVLFGNPETTTGGNALKFYASVRVDIRRVQAIKDGDQNVGNRVKVKIVKNKVAPPFRTCEFDLMFGEGISKLGEIVDLGVEYNILRKSGSWFSYGDSKLAQGREALKQLLRDNPELCEELEEKIRAAMKDNAHQE